jgi:hypothetical protein
MGMFRQSPPNLPIAGGDIDALFMNQLTNVLRLYFTTLNAVQTVSLAGANFDLNTLPTEAALATLRSGDVYRDSTAGNVLKVKV